MVVVENTALLSALNLMQMSLPIPQKMRGKGKAFTWVSRSFQLDLLMPKYCYDHSPCLELHTLRQVFQRSKIASLACLRLALSSAVLAAIKHHGRRTASSWRPYSSGFRNAKLSNLEPISVEVALTGWAEQSGWRNKGSWLIQSSLISQSFWAWYIGDLAVGTLGT